MNVWAPANATLESKLPVWLFIQGGGKLQKTTHYSIALLQRYTKLKDNVIPLASPALSSKGNKNADGHPTRLGYTSNANFNWNGSEVVEKSSHNVIFVNFNYRVGLWGFLGSESVRGDGDLNVGLLDQRMAMLWVKKYIAQVRTPFQYPHADSRRLTLAPVRRQSRSRRY